LPGRLRKSKGALEMEGEEDGGTIRKPRILAAAVYKPGRFPVILAWD